MEDISGRSLIQYGFILFVVGGLFGGSFVPDQIDLECKTPNDRWIEDGKEVVGYMIECP